MNRDDIKIGKCVTEANVLNWGVENEKESEIIDEIPKERKKRTMFDKARLSIKNKKVFFSYKKDQEESKKDNTLIFNQVKTEQIEIIKMSENETRKYSIILVEFKL